MLMLIVMLLKPVHSLSCLQCAAVPNYPTVCPDDGVLDQLEVSFDNIVSFFVFAGLHFFYDQHPIIHIPHTNILTHIYDPFPGLDGLHDLDP